MEARPRALLLLACLALVGWIGWDSQRALFKPRWRDVFSLGRPTEPGAEELGPSRLLDFARLVNESEAELGSLSAVQKLHDLILHDNLFSIIVADGQYSDARALQLSSAPVANESACQEQLRAVLNHLEAHPNHWLEPGKRNHQIARYLDSFGKPGANVALGNVWWTGSYESCSSARLDLVEGRAERPPLAMRYCWTRWRARAWPAEHEHTFPSASIRAGACIPEACDSRAIERGREQLSALVVRNWPQWHRDNLQLHSLYCLPDERSPLRRMPLGGRLYLAALLAWLLAILLATWLRSRFKSRRRAEQALELAAGGRAEGEALNQQHHKQRRQLQQLDERLGAGLAILEALSIKRSLKKFLANDFHVDYKRLAAHEEPRVDLNMLNSLKFIMCVCIVAAHCVYMHLIYHNSIDPIYRRANDGFTGASIMSMAVFVDTFFVIFGALSGFFASAYVGRVSLCKIWLGYQLRSILRIMPLYYLALGFVRLVAPYLSKGPWWDYGTSELSRRGSCANSTGLNLLLYFSTELRNTEIPCLPQSWFLSSYFTACLYVPILIWLICKLNSEGAKIALVFFLQAASVVYFLQRLARQSSLRTEWFTWHPALMVNLLNKFEYVGGYGVLEQTGLIAVGCYAGNLGYRYHSGQIQEWPAWLRGRAMAWCATVAVPIVFFAPVLGQLAYILNGKTHSMAMIAIGMLFIKLAWPTLNLIIGLLGCSIHKRALFVRFLSHSLWHSCNKLTLIVFLIHWEVADFAYSANEDGPNHGYTLDFFKNYTFCLIVSLIIAFLVFVFIQAPFYLLLAELFKMAEKHFVAEHKKGTQKNGLESDNNIKLARLTNSSSDQA